MSLRYRATITDPGVERERPVQIFGDRLPEVNRWAATMLSQAVAENAYVQIFETEEREIACFVKPAKPVAKGAGA